MLTDSHGNRGAVHHLISVWPRNAQHIMVMYKGSRDQACACWKMLQLSQHPKHTWRLVAHAVSCSITQRIISVKKTWRRHRVIGRGGQVLKKGEAINAVDHPQ